MSNPFNCDNCNKGYITDIEEFNGRKCPKKSYKCTHAGCQATWDEKKEMFICPCHGSKFDKDGKVIEGPAKEDLKC